MVYMELVGAILELIRCIGAPTCTYLGNHRNLEENVNDLRRRLGDLNVRKQDIQSANEAEIRRRKVVRKEVEKWLEDVQRMNTKMEKIERKMSAVSYLSRACLGRRVRQMTEEVKEIYHQGCFPGGVAIYGPPATGVTLQTTDLEGETEVKGEIWRYLMGDEVAMIGVCGMGGIGKTTIMKHTNNQLLKETCFDKVIWITVSKELNIFNLQEAIARAMNLVLPEDVLERATALIEILRTKRYVLILDDVWEQFSLLDVGIPEPTLHGGSKLVLTSRSAEVCKSMGCKVLKVQPLSKEESLNLFLNHVGHSTVLQVPTLMEIVNLIVEHCGGLPLAIVTIAGSMKGVDDDHEWRNVLNELNERVKSVKGLDTKIFQCLMFSYDRLKDPKIQDCFLYCSLYPEDYAIEKNELIENWIDERLIDECGSRQAMQDRGHSVLNKLVNNCLLEMAMAYNKIVVRMHDVLRDMALSIKSGDSRFMVKAGMQLNELPGEHEWTSNLEKVSLMDNSILEIPPHLSPKCHNLSTLLLQQNDFLESIPESFFEHMRGLKVLDLSYTSIRNLPSSISNLENLVALILRNCDKLRYVPSLAKLKMLRKLDLYNTAINELPHGIEMLANLVYLGLHSKDLKELPMGILPVFSHLQYLATTLYVNAEELAKLRKLETFSGSFLELSDFAKYENSMPGQWPRNYVFVVGSSKANNPTYTLWSEQFERPDHYRSVKFIDGKIRNEDPIVLPNDLDELYIEKFHDLRSLSNISLFHEANDLRKCGIRDCEGMECMVDLSLSSYNSLQNIEELDLEGLRALRELVRIGVAVESTSQAPTPASIFSSLKILCLVGCSSMKKVLSVEQLQDLVNLEEIVVISCKEMEFIMTSKEDENHQGEIRVVDITTVTLPSLRKLTLLELPKLESICSTGVMIQADSLQSLEVGGCQQLKRIHLSLPPSLNQIILDSMDWWESVEWDDPHAKDVLSTFVLLCPSFEFPSKEDEH